MTHHKQSLTLLRCCMEGLQELARGYILAVGTKLGCEHNAGVSTRNPLPTVLCDTADMLSLVAQNPPRYLLHLSGYEPRCLETTLRCMGT
jgi:hypothetical protein